MQVYSVVCMLIVSISYVSSAVPETNLSILKLLSPAGDSSGWSMTGATARRSPREAGDSGAVTVKGEPGARGLRGRSGIKGEKGETSEKGQTGATGKQGDVGPTGATGSPGERGETGPVGIKGDLGTPGDKGDKGDTGDRGARGQTGSPGIKGDVGIPGVTGQMGSRGEKGISGQKGNTGEQGNIGLTGEQGDRGERGLVGLKGSFGDPGAEGLPGPVGPPGKSIGMSMPKLSPEQCIKTCTTSMTIISASNQGSHPLPTDFMTDHTLYCSMCGLQTSVQKYDGVTENLMKEVAALKKLTLKLVACGNFDPECVTIHHIQGKDYLVGRKSYNWFDAEKICAAVGMSHFHPETFDVYKSVFTFIATRYGTDSDYWIGANDKDNKRHFVWADGGTPKLSLWGRGEPGKTTEGVKHCVAHITKQDLWKLENCKEKRLMFICS